LRKRASGPPRRWTTPARKNWQPRSNASNFGI